ncbi:MAG: DUF6899 family protein [Candidatus Heimdallarchaeaceae archaeon]
MPYILDEDRPKFDKAIEVLTGIVNAKGDLNYTVCELVGRLILKTKISYTQISEWIDGVHGAERELTRRLLNPYEDIKIEENGDVQSFETILMLMKE